MATKEILRRTYDEAVFRNLTYDSFLEVLAEMQRRGYTMGLADGCTLVKAGALDANADSGDISRNVRAIAEQAEKYALENSHGLYKDFVLSVDYAIGGKRLPNKVAEAIAARREFIK